MEPTSRQSTIAGDQWPGPEGPSVTVGRGGPAATMTAMTTDITPDIPPLASPADPESFGALSRRGFLRGAAVPRWRSAGVRRRGMRDRRRARVELRSRLTPEPRVPRRRTITPGRPRRRARWRDPAGHVCRRRFSLAGGVDPGGLVGARRDRQGRG